MSKRYEDFTLTLSGAPTTYRLSARGERGLVVLDEPADDGALTQPIVMDALTVIRAGYAPGATEMVAVGTALYALLFPTPIADLWSKAQAYADQNQAELRLRLEVVADTLMGLPWELLYDVQTQSFLIPRVRFSLVRGIARAGVAVRPLQIEGTASILRLVASPTDRAQLLAGQGDWLTPLWQKRGAVTTIHAATAQELQAALRLTTPHILHFDGHGGWDEQQQDGYIILEDGQGNSVELNGATLFSLLDGSSVRLVVLAACKSGQAGTIKQLSGMAQRLMSGGALPAVVAMQYDVPDSAALRFAETFYESLAGGHPLDRAVTEGRKAILLQRGEGDSAWATPVLYLRATTGDLFPSMQRKVPFQVPSLTATDIPRIALLHQIRTALVNPVTQYGESVIIGIHGAGGYGKTSLARMICHDPVVKAAFPDGVLWVQIGQNAGMDERTRELALVGKVLNWIEALGGERGSVTDLPSATDRLNKVLGERRCLLVVDNVWQRNDGTPFLQGVNCAKVLTARNATAFPNEAIRIPIAGMTLVEATDLLTYGLTIPAAEEPRTRQLAQRLGEYPLLLSLVNRTLVERVMAEQSPVTESLTYVEDALTQFGVTAFDDEERAVQAVLKISLDPLTADEYKRLTELALFPEDTSIPIIVVTKLWQSSGGLSLVAADKLLSRLWQLSLLLTLDRRPDHKSLQLHDVVRAYLLEPLDSSTRQTIHHQIMNSLGVWKNWKLEDRYAWRWYTYHLQAAGQSDDLYNLLRDSAFRDGQQAALGDIRVALTDIQRALSVALAEDNIYRAIRLIRTYQDVYRTEQVSDDVFVALDGYQWETALQIAAYYGTPPRLQNAWVVVLYLQIAFEAALAGGWQVAEQALQSAFAFHRPPNYLLQRLVESFHKRIAVTLGQQQADGLDTHGWVARLGAPVWDVAPPTISDAAAEAQLERSVAYVAHFRHRLVSGESEAISSYDFADEEQAASESGNLSRELAQVADRVEGQALIQEALEAVLLNRYPFYRDIALGAMGVAVLAIPDGARASHLIRRLLATVLNDEGITFEWELPHQMMALATPTQSYVPFTLQQMMGLAHGTQDKWGTHWRVKSAAAATAYYQDDSASAMALLNQVSVEPVEALYAGYSVLHLLTLHNRYIEFGLLPPAFLVTKAGTQTTYVQDQFTLQPARRRLVQFAEQIYQQGNVPTVAEVERFLREEEDVDVQRFYCDYALSLWLVAEPRRIENIKAMIPHLLEKHGTTLDLYLARWVAVGGATIPKYEVEAVLAMMDQYIVLPPPSSEFG